MPKSKTTTGRLRGRSRKLLPKLKITNAGQPRGRPPAKNGPKPNKTTGRPRGRPPGKNGPKPNKTTGRPRGRPPAKNGSKPNKTTGRPRGRPPGKAPKPKNTITTTTGRRRGRPRKLALNNIEPVPAVDVGNVPMKQIIHPAAFPLGSNYLQANGHAFGDGASIYIGHTIDEAELNAEHDHQFFVRQMPNGETLLYRETDENIKIIAYYESDYKVVSTYNGQLYLLKPILKKGNTDGDGIDSR